MKDVKKSPSRKGNRLWTAAAVAWSDFPGSSCCLGLAGAWMRAAAAAELRNCSARMDGDLRGGTGEPQSGLVVESFSR